MSAKPVVIVISDLHLGGGAADKGDDHVFDQQQLAGFIDTLRASDDGQAGRIEHGTLCRRRHTQWWTAGHTARQRGVIDRLGRDRRGPDEADPQRCTGLTWFHRGSPAMSRGRQGTVGVRGISQHRVWPQASHRMCRMAQEGADNRRCSRSGGPD